MRFSLVTVLLCGAAGALCGGSALAADLPTPAATPESDVYNWTGAYVGADVGYVNSNSAASYDFPLFSTEPIDTHPTGWVGGLVLGANQQLPNGIVLGIEGDVDYGNVTDTIADLAAADHFAPGNTVTAKTDWAGSLRGRLGYAAGAFLPYLTAGLAVANTTVSATDGPLSQSAVLTGWTAGVGIEYAVDANWSVKGEVLYTDLGKHTWFSGDPWESTSDSTSETARFGVNYKF